MLDSLTSGMAPAGWMDSSLRNTISIFYLYGGHHNADILYDLSMSEKTK